MSSINRVLRNIAATKEQSAAAVASSAHSAAAASAAAAHHLHAHAHSAAAVAADSVYDFLFVLGQPRFVGSVQAVINPVAIH